MTPAELSPIEWTPAAARPAAPAVRVLRPIDAPRSPDAFEALDAIDDATIARALRDVRDARALRASPLCGLSAVARIARREAVAERSDAPRALAELLRTIVANALSAHRGAPVAQGAAARDALADGLVLDFTCGDADREAWSVLFHRFTSPTRFPAKAIERIGACSRRTVLRRAARGFVLVADRLRAVERAARDQDATAAEAEGAPAGERDGNARALEAADLRVVWRQTVAAIAPAEGTDTSNARPPEGSTVRALALSLLVDALESTLSDAWHVPEGDAPHA